jgi:hypothetical protein
MCEFTAKATFRDSCPNTASDTGEGNDGNDEDNGGRRLRLVLSIKPLLRHNAVGDVK